MVLSIGHVSFLSLHPSRLLPIIPLWGYGLPYHTCVALLPLPTEPYIRSFFPTSLSPPILSSILCVHSVAPCSIRPFPDRGLVYSNSVAPFIMVSDPMDAPYGTDAGRAIKSSCPLFRRRYSML